MGNSFKEQLTFQLKINQMGAPLSVKNISLEMTSSNQSTNSLEDYYVMNTLFITLKKLLEDPYLDHLYLTIYIKYLLITF